MDSICVCLQYGFGMVMQHREVINYIAISITHKSLRTKALVLELLAAICLVTGGHQLILSAFDNLKEILREKHRYVIKNNGGNQKKLISDYFIFIFFFLNIRLILVLYVAYI